MADIEWETEETEMDEVGRLLGLTPGANILQKAAYARLTTEIRALEQTLDKLYNKRGRAAALREERRRKAEAAKVQAKKEKIRQQGRVRQATFRKKQIERLGGGEVGLAKLRIIQADARRTERAKARAR